jgi:hypothetical protein
VNALTIGSFQYDARTPERAAAVVAELKADGWSDVRRKGATVQYTTTLANKDARRRVAAVAAVFDNAGEPVGAVA